MNKPVPRMTLIADCERQLWPQPPHHAKPVWSGTGRLEFYERALREGPRKALCEKLVWRQIIPEWRWLNQHGTVVQNMQLVWRREFGWILKFRLTHALARQIWYDVLCFKTKKELEVIAP